MLLKIGDFSRLSQVSIKMLRHYDELGLFKPAHVDRFTGYRYYTLDQLPRLNQILAFKDLGLSLEQVIKLLEENLAPDQIQVMLRLKRAELQQQLEDTQARLERVDMRLRHIAMESKMVDYEIIVKRIEPQRVLSIREIAHTAHDINRLFGEVNEAIRQQELKSVAPWIAMYHHQGYRETDMDLEIAVPVKDSVDHPLPLEGGRQMTVRTIPAIDIAVSALLRGSYNTIGDVYAALSQYIHANGYQYLGPAREVYIRGPEYSANAEEYLTEIQEPVMRANSETSIDDADSSSGWKDLRPIRAYYARFTQRARGVLRLAEVAALEYHQPKILPVHVLLGLLQETDGMAGVALRNLGLSSDMVRKHIPVATLPLSETEVSDAARQIVAYASNEAQQLEHDYIGTEHLLLGLLQQSEADVSRVLKEAKLSAEQIRTKILRLVNCV